MTEKPWADKPFSLIPIPGTPGARSSANAGILAVAIEMANVHCVLVRGLNSIYVQAPHVIQSTDIADFMLYIKAWGDSVHHHHSCEETMFFPLVEALAREAGVVGAMDTNLEQHHLFDQKLQDTIAYVEEVHLGRSEYSSAGLLALIDSFAPALTQHLHDEIDSLLNLEDCDGEKMKKAMVETAEVALKDADSNLVVPLFLGCIDKTYPGGENFPPVPFFVPYLNAYWFSRKHQRIWRFNPSDHWGNPRALQFLL
ncbi:hypothetical protein P153DRAFT_362918 [Dothidotthia symphoricarpi CBS 119687]|uniref:Hemerythrin-like domain-containing protein n=1 Tax=Dothidotthia symphoricarpi CBS 119687 TaxID=1392245 RepID=A0A6A6ARS0_9PLEO|nr:uncharacterized protein P153DRAFT_362918 [Dothidotthia symphoricarpi CBS 119687]KAF2133878.1 hypothetical protein P153DRAFT_362918 [Dothidotthia symphoricarpi CBS 119687]